MYRIGPLATGEIYHIFNKSIAGFKVFNGGPEYIRIIAAIRYYQMQDHRIALSDFLRLEQVGKGNINEALSNYLKDKKEKLVDILAYCIMPTHIHLILKQVKDKGISFFMNSVLNSYSRYFNTKHKRKGPLWEGRFKDVWIGTDEQLLHLTRYIHLNPVTAYLVDKPELWVFSSYKEYLTESKLNNRFCNYENVLRVIPNQYKKFVDDTISYQRELAKIKSMMLD